jgi:hypothetical protein
LWVALGLLTGHSQVALRFLSGYLDSSRIALRLL